MSLTRRCLSESDAYIKCPGLSESCPIRPSHVLSMMRLRLGPGGMDQPMTRMSSAFKFML